MLILVFAFLSLVFGEAPLYGLENPERIPGEYIVIYHENVTAEYAESHPSKFVGLMWKYNIGNTFKGFSAKLDEKEISYLRQDVTVKEIHCNGMEHALESAQTCDATQAASPSWGICRVSYGGSMPASFRTYYYSYNADGTGVNVYVLDTGIYIEHNDFGGRARYGANFVDNVDTDENSHGTHCAGTIGGERFGIAKGVNLIAVKVLGASGSGSTAGVVQGINWVTNQHVNNGGPSVASMSLGSTSDGGKNAAIAASVGQGVVYSVAAGNSNADACYHYPASSPYVICVASTEHSGGTDRRSSFSNYGECVDIFAPGSSITSCGITGPNSSSVKSGTSMACPHVSGMAAVVLSTNPNYTPAQVESALTAMAQRSYVSNPGTGTPNFLLYNGC